MVFVGDSTLRMSWNCSCLLSLNFYLFYVIFCSTHRYRMQSILLVITVNIFGFASDIMYCFHLFISIVCLCIAEMNENIHFLLKFKKRRPTPIVAKFPFPSVLAVECPCEHTAVRDTSKVVSPLKSQWVAHPASRLSQT